MDLVHPVMKKMLTMGCSSQARTMLAFQTYIDLCEIFVLYDVGYHFDSDLDLIYITTKDKSRPITSIFITVLVSESISHEVIQSWFLKLKELYGENTEFFISVREVDTTAAFFKISDGMVTPLTLEAARIKDTEEDNMKYVRQEVFNMRKELYQKLKNPDVCEPTVVDKNSDIVCEPTGTTVEKNPDFCCESTETIVEKNPDIVCESINTVAEDPC